MLRQAEKRQHRGACALRGSNAVWWESDVSVIGNVNLLQCSGKGERAEAPAVASEVNRTACGSDVHRLAVASSEWAQKRRRCRACCGRRAEKRCHWSAFCGHGTADARVGEVSVPPLLCLRGCDNDEDDYDVDADDDDVVM